MRKNYPLIGFLILALATGFSIYRTNQISNQASNRTDDRAMVAKERADTAAINVVKAKKVVDKTAKKTDRVAKKQNETIRVLTKAGINGLPGATGSEGTPGLPGPAPTDKQVQEAVAAFCATVSCFVGPTTAQVTTAIEIFCKDRRCVGQDGKDAAITDSQLDAAVKRYCAKLENCSQGPQGVKGDKGDKGESGPVGPIGPVGPQGPAIASFTFTASGVTQTCTDPDGDLNYTCVAQ